MEDIQHKVMSISKKTKYTQHLVINSCEDILKIRNKTKCLLSSLPFQVFLRPSPGYYNKEMKKYKNWKGRKTMSSFINHMTFSV